MANTNATEGSLIGLRPIIYLGKDTTTFDCLGAGCQKHSAMWTVQGYNGYVDACADHAKEFLTDAIEDGSMVDEEA